MPFRRPYRHRAGRLTGPSQCRWRTHCRGTAAARSECVPQGQPWLGCSLRCSRRQAVRTPAAAKIIARCRAAARSSAGITTGPPRARALRDACGRPCSCPCARLHREVSGFGVGGRWEPRWWAGAWRALAPASTWQHSAASRGGRARAPRPAPRRGLHHRATLRRSPPARDAPASAPAPGPAVRLARLGEELIAGEVRIGPSVAVTTRLANRRVARGPLRRRPGPAPPPPEHGSLRARACGVPADVPVRTDCPWPVAAPGADGSATRGRGDRAVVVSAGPNGLAAAI